LGRRARATVAGANARRPAWSAHVATACGTLSVCTFGGRVLFERSASTARRGLAPVRIACKVPPPDAARTSTGNIKGLSKFKDELSRN
jgi:hypothetical protein